MEPPSWRNHIALKRCPELLGQFSLLAMVVNDDAGFLKKRGAHTSIASRLAPTMVLCRTQNMCSPQITCGSELARDGRQR
ncbi:hypothetical protein PspS34_07580 [Pseudomonas sp. S34]|nr:hypothetical protein PspS34_07580 [Pseudomonas sp. S34]